MDGERFFVARRPLLTTLRGSIFRLADLPRTEAELIACLNARPLILVAIALSSTTLSARMRAWLGGGELDHRAKYALMRYLTRMVSRSTPYGLYTVLSLGRLGPATRFSRTLDPDDFVVRHELSYAAEKALLRLSGSDAHRLRWNPTLLMSGNTVRYWTSEQRDLTCSQVVVELDALANEVLGEVVSGDLALAHAGNRGLIEELVQAEAIVAASVIPSLLRRNSGSRVPAVAGDSISVLRGLLENADNALLDPDLLRMNYDQIESTFRSITGFQDSKPVVCASVLEQEGESHPQLGHAAALEAEGVARVLMSVFGQTSVELRELARRFAARHNYESVPLLEFLHGDLGRRLVSAPSHVEETERADVVARDVLLTKRIVTALTDRAFEVKLTMEELEQCARFEIRASVAAAPVFALTQAAGDEQGFALHWRGMEVGSGVSLLSRFSGLSNTWQAKLRAFLDALSAAHQPAMLVELAYRPNDAISTVLRRPALLSHAIYVTPDAECAAVPIELNDIRVCVRQGRFRLWADSLQREIIPVLTVPHYYRSSSNPVYRFLASIVDQYAEQAEFRIPKVLEDLPFCPRITLHRTVLRAATWRIDRVSSGDQLKSVESFRAYARRLNLPQLICWGERDQVLTVDISNDLAVAAMLDAVSSERVVKLMESLGESGQSDGAPIEIVMPMIFRPSRPVALRPLLLKHDVAPRRFLPGRDYVYFQIFTSITALESLASRLGSDLLPYLKRRNLPFFFLKYSDPVPHLRLRVDLRGVADSLRVQQVLAKRLERWISTGLAESLSLSTYEQEIERYGGVSIFDISEAYFCADSIAALGLLELSKAAIDETEFFLIAMVLSNLFIARDFRIPAGQIALLIADQIDRMEGAANERDSADIKAGLLLRGIKSEIKDVLTGQENGGLGATIKAILSQRSRSTSQVRARLPDTDTLRDLHDIAAAHMHMSMNRLSAVPWGMDRERVVLALTRRVSLFAQHVGLEIGGADWQPDLDDKQADCVVEPV